MGGRGSGRKADPTKLFVKQQIGNYGSSEAIILPNLSGSKRHPDYTPTRQETKMIYIVNPIATDDFPLAFIHSAATVISIVAVTDVGTVDFNIEKRNQLTPDVAGTDIDGSEMQATTSGLNQTSFTAGDIDPDTWLNYNASAVATTPTKVWVKITYQYT